MHVLIVNTMNMTVKMLGRRAFSFNDRHDTKVDGKARLSCVIELQLMKFVIIFSRLKVKQIIPLSVKTVT